MSGSGRVGLRNNRAGVGVFPVLCALGEEIHHQNLISTLGPFVKTAKIHLYCPLLDDRLSEI
jgi:hypothetical protein